MNCYLGTSVGYVGRIQHVKAGERGREAKTKGWYYETLMAEYDFHHMHA